MEIGSATNAAYQPATVQKRPASAETAMTDETTDDADSSQTQAASDINTNSSALKSFAYGTLGLERPDQQATEQNQFYSAGKWVAAAVTIGGIISLFV
jgi:hypothetical protein